MKKHVVWVSFAIVVYLFLACSQHPSAIEKFDSLSELRYMLEELFSDPAFYTAHWGVAIQSLDTGEFFYLRNERKGFMPASNMKLFTTAAALVKFGPDFTLQTHVYANGTINNGVLYGDLILRGMADPALSGRYYDGDMTYVFRAWVDSLKEAGIQKIDGRILGDDSYFEDQRLGDSWSWDYLSDYYAAQISALTFNDNCVDIIFTPGESAGEPTTFRLEPDTDYITVENHVMTADRVEGTEIDLYRQQGKNRVVCTGTLSKKTQRHREWVTVENPALYTAKIFRSVMLEHGISVGKAMDINELDDDYDYDYSQRVAIHQAPPLYEIVKTVNKVSQNLFAELLLRVLGKEYGGKGCAEKGETVAKEWFATIGINPDEIFMADGSGLSTINMVSPQGVTELLRAMRQHPYGRYYYQSLPIAGVDGTIADRMQGTAAENNVHAKTGYIDRVRALSGYVTTMDGEELCFSMIVNNYTVPTSLCNAKQDLVCEWLANFSR